MFYSFSVGRATGLVLDSGGSTTSAVPVYDGYVLKKGVLHQSVGGDILSQQIRDYIKNGLHLDVTPLYKIASKKPVPAGQPPQLQLRKRPDTTESFDNYQVSVGTSARPAIVVWILTQEALYRELFMNTRNLCLKYQKFHTTNT